MRWPTVPIVFCETRKLAEEWTYRWRAAALSWARTEPAALDGIELAGTAAPSAPGPGPAG